MRVYHLHNFFFFLNRQVDIKDFTSTVSGGVEKGFTRVGKNGLLYAEEQEKKFIWLTASQCSGEELHKKVGNGEEGLIGVLWWGLT